MAHALSYDSLLGWGQSWSRKWERASKKRWLARRLGGGRFRPVVEYLEDRVAPAGQKVAYLVAGLGGQVYPLQPGNGFPAALVNSLEQDGFEVDLANWNSSDYLDLNTGQYNSCATGTLQTNVGDSLFGDPGSPPHFTVTSSYTTPSNVLGINIPSLTIPTALGVQIDIGSPTQDAFVNATVNRLKTFDSQDTIVLIGHSLGGSAVLSVAQELYQQAPGVRIALLGTLDPVGYAPSSNPVVSAFGTAVDLLNSEIPGIPCLSIGPIEIQPISFLNGVWSNADGETPGFRGDVFGGGVVDGPVPPTVDYFYNRWQTNTMFPVDFQTSGNITSLAQVSDQEVQNTTDSYPVINSQDPWDILGLIPGYADVNLLTYQNILGVEVPTGYNSDFLHSTAQLHENFPQNPTVVSELEAIAGLIATGDQPTALTTTNVTSSDNTSVIGQTVTFTASVSAGAVAASGTVTFTEGMVTLGTASLDTTGTATFSTNVLSAGIDAITVVYSGDRDCSPSLGTCKQTVSQYSTSTVLTSNSANPSAVGDTVIFTVAVSDLSGTELTPTGTVTFYDGPTSIGTAGLTSGTATFTTSTLGPGTHPITAIYGRRQQFQRQSVHGSAADRESCRHVYRDS